MKEVPTNTTGSSLHHDDAPIFLAKDGRHDIHEALPRASGDQHNYRPQIQRGHSETHLVVTTASSVSLSSFCVSTCSGQGLVPSAMRDGHPLIEALASQRDGFGTPWVVVPNPQFCSVLSSGTWISACAHVRPFVPGRLFGTRRRKRFSPQSKGHAQETQLYPRTKNALPNNHCERFLICILGARKGDRVK